MSPLSIRPRLAVTGVAIAAGAATAIALSGSPAQALVRVQAPAARTFTIQDGEKGAQFVHIRNTKGSPEKGNATGDVLVITSPIVDAAGKRIGSDAAHCITTFGSKQWQKSIMTCEGVFTLPDGTITAAGNILAGSETNTLAVTGGTGAYAGAKGSIQVDGGKGVNTVTLVD